MKFFLITALFLGFFVSCSMNKGENSESTTTEGISDNAASEGNNLGDVSENELEGLLDEEVLGEENKVEEMAKTEEPVQEIASEEMGAMAAVEEVKEAVVDRDIATMPIASSENGEFTEYKVQKNETLMWVAFKLYGDYRKWRDLANWNGSHLAKGKLNAGMKLKYKSSSFVWRPQGTPYLIQNGDYLSLISKKVYGTPMKWKAIWENNKAMIRYPDLIFAGFTLYYVPKEDLMANNF